MRGEVRVGRIIGTGMVMQKTGKKAQGRVGDDEVKGMGE